MRHSFLGILTLLITGIAGFNLVHQSQSSDQVTAILSNASSIYIDASFDYGDSVIKRSLASESNFKKYDDNKNKVFLDCAKKQQDELKCMICNNIAEAHNQSFEGQVLVGISVLKRVLSADYPNSVCDVIYQKFQYSWTIFPQNYSITVSQFDKLKEAFLVAKAEVNKYPCLTHYHNNEVLPDWHDDYNFNRVEGDHFFYNTGHCRRVATKLKLALND